MLRTLCVLGILGCSTGAPPNTTTANTTATPSNDLPGKPSGPPKISTPPATVTVGDATVTVEIEATEARIERGMMYRQHLPPDDGMLFLMNKEFDWSFWMRNCLIPLDLIFITRGMAVAGIVANAKPGNDDLLKVGVPSLYVLEVNGGWSAAHHVAAGTPVKFENVPQRTDSTGVY